MLHGTAQDNHGPGAPMSPNYRGGGFGSQPGIQRGIWKYLFFAAAVCTVAAAVISMISFIVTFTVAPFEFTNLVYLTFFGLLMLVLDCPIHNERFQEVKFHIFRFVRFMTRFVGRGVWYMFLGTMVFASLWDLDVSPFLGVVMGGYIIILGLVAMYFGLHLSIKVNRVREVLRTQPQYAHACPPDGLTNHTLRDLLKSVNGFECSDDEFDYIISGLANVHYHAHQDEKGNVIKLSKEDYDNWLKPGYMAVL